ncbi:MAG: hypothetical protein V3U92_03475 [Cellulophaga sp.]
MSKHLQNQYAEYLLKDNILYFNFKQNVEINLEAAQQIVKDRILIQDGQSYPVLSDIRQLKFITKPAREYMASEGTVMISAIAFITEPIMVSDITVKVFMRKNKPTLPAKQIFTDIPEALTFLRKFAI